VVFPLRSTVAFVATFWLALALGFAPVAYCGPESELLERVNAIRGAEKLIPLAPSDELAAVALAHARDMARQGYFAHLDRDGRSPLDRVNAAGVSGFALLAENLGTSNASGERLSLIVSAWLDSHDHRENLLNPAFNTSGIGIVRTPEGHTIAVQLYASF